MNPMIQRTIHIAIVCGVLMAPLVTSAHERHVFEIKGKQYQVTVGSLNEPLVVDDKSGVDFRVATLPGNTPVDGLQESLKVELIAADKKKILDFSAVYGTPGAYKAPFYPTVATTLSYRVFGEINETPFNVTFTCQPSGHAEATEDTTRTEISPGVVRTLKTGSYGCPGSKADLGFPEPSAELFPLSEGSRSGPTSGIAIAGLALAIIALVNSARKRS